MNWIEPNQAPHKTDLLIKIKAKWSPYELYITGGFFDADSNTWEVYGFDLEKEGYYIESVCIIPEDWLMS